MVFFVLLLLNDACSILYGFIPREMTVSKHDTCLWRTLSPFVLQWAQANVQCHRKNRLLKHYKPRVCKRRHRRLAGFEGHIVSEHSSKRLIPPLWLENKDSRPKLNHPVHTRGWVWWDQGLTILSTASTHTIAAGCLGLGTKRTSCPCLASWHVTASPAARENPPVLWWAGFGRTRKTLGFR